MKADAPLKIIQETLMSNVRQRKKTLHDLAMYFAEKGKVLTQAEYIKAKDKPVTFWGIRNVFRSYSRMAEMLENNEPDLFALIGKKEEPKPVAPKPAPVVAAAPKPQPKPAAAVKPAPKPAVEEK